MNLVDHPIHIFPPLPDTAPDILSPPKKARELNLYKRIKTLSTLAEKLKKKIFEQEFVIETVVKLIKNSYAGLRDETKPEAIMMFTGATGSGKTELAKQLAKLLNKRLIRLDMSECSEKVSVTRLFGAAPGYAGYENGGQLVNQIREYPDCVLLLDEIEKAHSDIYNVLLQVFDYATLTDNKGQKADFSKTIIIMTSNVNGKNGTKMIGFVEQARDNNDEEIKYIFSSEFRNRIDAVVKFNRLSPENIHLIVRKELDNLSLKLRKKKTVMRVTEDCIQQLSKEGYSSEYGAREVSRLIDKKIKPLLVNDLLYGRLINGGTVKIDWREGVGYIMKIIKSKGDFLW